MPLPSEAHHDYQRRYYARTGRVESRMSPVQTPYVRRHLERVVAALGIAPPARLLEVGAGMGRFSLLLAARGYRVTAVDLSPELLARLRENRDRLGTLASSGAGSVDAVCADAAAVADAAPGPYDAAVGFFFLHHLASVAELARGLARVLAPGARVAFCEPNAFNPSFYLQVLLTPGMTWAGERGIARMRPGVLVPALEGAGFVDVRIDRYGLFPPFLHNRRPARVTESILERFRPLRPVLAFQVVSGTYRG